MHDCINICCSLLVCEEFEIIKRGFFFLFSWFSAEEVLRGHGLWLLGVVHYVYSEQIWGKKTESFKLFANIYSV